jgi:glycosyltransferase involved in cell wall biosynthesis
MGKWWAWTGVPEDRMTFVPLGVDVQVFKPFEHARTALGIASGQKVIVYAARLSRENGIDVTLRAIARLISQWPDIKLHVLGDGPECKSACELAVALDIADNVVWHGWVDFHRLPLFYSATNVFVFSGFSGGTPRVLLQAMACGAPVVAPAISGIVDHISHDKTGLMFSAGDDQAMADQIHRLLYEPHRARRLGEQGQTYVHSTVAWDVVIHRIRSLYHTLTKDSALEVVR